MRSNWCKLIVRFGINGCPVGINRNCAVCISPLSVKARRPNTNIVKTTSPNSNTMKLKNLLKMRFSYHIKVKSLK